jgi:iron(III) transport system substrate-binding protein
MKNERKRLIVSVVLLSFISLMPGYLCHAEQLSDIEKAAKAEGSVMLYTTTPSVMMKSVGAEFEKKYGIKFEMYRATSARLTERFLSEKRGGKILADVITMSDPTLMMRLKADAHLKGYSPPEGKAIAKDYKDEGWWYTIRVMPMVFQYNTKYISKEEAPKSYQELFLPENIRKYRGKFFTGDPRFRGSQYEYFFVMRERFGIEFWRNLAKFEIKEFARSGGAQAQKVITGEYWMTVPQSSYKTSYDAAKGAPVDLVFLKEGSTVINGVAGLVKGGPHSNAGKLLLNYLCSNEGQRALVKSGRFHSARADVPNPFLPGLESFKVLYTDFDKLIKHDRKKYLREWEEIFLPK